MLRHIAKQKEKRPKKKKNKKPAKKSRKGSAGERIITTITVEEEEEVVTEMKCQKWRIHPTAEQKKTLALWMETTRWIYNKAAAAVNEKEKKAILKELREEIETTRWCDPAQTPERMRDVPYEIRDSPLRDLVKAVKALRAKEKKFKRKFKFRKKKDDVSSITLRKRQLNCKTEAGDVWPSLFGTTEDRSPMRTEKGKTLPLVFEHDTRLLFERKTGFYYLCVPMAVPPEIQGHPTTDEGEEVVSIDPGIRTFATCYDPSGAITEWGCGKETTRLLFWLLRKASRLEEKARCAKGRHRRRIGAVAARIRKRSTDLVNELHRKLSLWLCRNHAAVLLPKFDTRQIVQHKGRPKRKLGKKTSGACVRLSHYKFRTYLQNKAREFGTEVVICDERHTSMACGCCGKLNRGLGSSKTFLCPSCGYRADRDHNAARNVLLRYVSLNEITESRDASLRGGGVLDPQQ